VPNQPHIEANRSNEGKSKTLQKQNKRIRCVVAQLVARRLAVGHARVRLSARHPWRFFSYEEAMSIQEDRLRMYDCTVLMIVKIISIKGEW
jgi:hypothetical protein